MDNTAIRDKIMGNRAKTGRVVIDASDRFKAKRLAAAQSDPHEVAPSPTPKRATAKVKALVPRIERDRKCVFILAKDEHVRDENGVRCVPFTVVPAPHHPDDDQRYLTPYRLRGWDLYPFVDPDDRELPCALHRQADPYAVFETALLDLPVEERAAYRRPSGYKLYHFVPDPLA